MRFLLNMNVCRAVADVLGELGHECVHVRDAALISCDDAEIVESARRNDQVIVTHDLDYGDLLALGGHRQPSVIIFRLRTSFPSNLADRLRSVWEHIAPLLPKGAIVVITDTTVRVRLLPLNAQTGP